jgi:hypothetical protein
MHRLWTIPELLQIIFDHLDCLIRNATLNRLANVNQQLSAVAIPLLWKNLSGTEPLLRLLSGCYDKGLLRKLKEGNPPDVRTYLMASLNSTTNSHFQ